MPLPWSFQKKPDPLLSQSTARSNDSSITMRLSFACGMPLNDDSREKLSAPSRQQSNTWIPDAISRATDPGTSSDKLVSETFLAGSGYSALGGDRPGIDIGNHIR